MNAAQYREQLDSTRSPKTKRQGKKGATRHERRQGKKDPENAPAKRGYKGWSS